MNDHTPKKQQDEEQQEHLKWLSNCLKALFEHTEQTGEKDKGKTPRLLESEDISKLFERLKDKNLRLHFARLIDNEVKKSVTRPAVACLADVLLLA